MRRYEPPGSRATLLMTNQVVFTILNDESRGHCLTMSRLRWATKQTIKSVYQLDDMSFKEFYSKNNTLVLLGSLYEMIHTLTRKTLRKQSISHSCWDVHLLSDKENASIILKDILRINDLLKKLLTKKIHEEKSKFFEDKKIISNFHSLIMSCSSLAICLS